MPNHWNIITNFGYKHAVNKPSSEKIRILVENTELLDNEAMSLEKDLMKDLIYHEGFLGNPLGIVLISNNKSCKNCGAKLLVRADRPSFLTGYTGDFGTVPFTHFRKYCSKKGCSFTQHYGFHSSGKDIEYDNNWAELPYFMATNQTVFEMKMLREFNAELLIGQVSYNQKCDIYNIIFTGTKTSTK